MSDIKVTDSHLTFLGKSYCRGGAPEIEIGSYGEKKTPITKTNYLEVQGKVPATKLKIKECVTVDSSYAGTTEANLLANINVFGVFKGSSNTALKDLRTCTRNNYFCVDADDRRSTVRRPSIMFEV